MKPAAVLYIVGIVALVLFLARYLVRVRWRHFDGVALVVTILMIIYNATLAVSVILFGEWPGVQVARLVGALAFAFVAVGMLIGLIRVQRNGEAKRNGEEKR